MYRRTGRGRMLLIVFLAVCIALITLDFRVNDGGAIEKARDFSSVVVDPIQRGVSAVVRPIGNFFSSIGELSNLRERNAELEARVNEMQSQIQQADSVAQENSTLRAELELDESWASMERVAAQVISRPSSNYRWYLEIDKGKNDGIRPDMAVIDARGLVGKIVTATATTSNVLLLVDPTGAAAAKIGDGEVTGVVRGNGAGQELTMDFVGSEANVTAGDQVFTAVYNEGIFPPNIPIGYVSSVSADTAALTQAIRVMPYVDFTSIEFVQVLLESGPKLDLATPKLGAGKKK